MDAGTQAPGLEHPGNEGQTRLTGASGVVREGGDRNPTDRDCIIRERVAICRWRRRQSAEDDAQHQEKRRMKPMTGV